MALTNPNIVETAMMKAGSDLEAKLGGMDHHLASAFMTVPTPGHQRERAPRYIFSDGYIYGSTDTRRVGQ